MMLPTKELLLALRSPTSGWLATLICALDEAVRDPDFSDHHRAMLHHILEASGIPEPVSAAAEARLTQFEQATAQAQDNFIAAVVEPGSRPRPKLTLVGSAAA